METESGSDRSLESEELAKYQEIWKGDGYRRKSPAFHRFFGEITESIETGESVIEFGCGQGLALKAIQEHGNTVLGIDIADNCLSVNVPFKQANLWEPMDARADTGYCVDVMEHIPPEKVSAVFENIMECVPKCLFIACLLGDKHGDRIGKPLHLTIESWQWWRETAGKYGRFVYFYHDHRAAHFLLCRN